MILNEVRRIKKIEENLSSCKLEIVFHNVDCFNIIIQPNKIIQYETLCFQCKTEEEYQKILLYIINQIIIQSIDNLSFKIEFENYNPMIDENYGNHYLTLSAQNKIVFKESFDNDTELQSILIKHLEPLFYLTSNSNL